MQTYRGDIELRFVARDKEHAEEILEQCVEILKKEHPLVDEGWIIRDDDTFGPFVSDEPLPLWYPEIYAHT